MRSKEQMRRIAARGIVAVMANVKTVRDWTMRYLPRNPMGQVHRVGRKSKLSIATRVELAAPLPAIFRGTGAQISRESFSERQVMIFKRRQLLAFAQLRMMPRT